MQTIIPPTMSPRKRASAYLFHALWFSTFTPPLDGGIAGGGQRSSRRSFIDHLFCELGNDNWAFIPGSAACVSPQVLAPARIAESIHPWPAGSTCRAVGLHSFSMPFLMVSTASFLQIFPLQ